MLCDGNQCDTEDDCDDGFCALNTKSACLIVDDTNVVNYILKTPFEICSDDTGATYHNCYNANGDEIDCTAKLCYLAKCRNQLSLLNTEDSDIEDNNICLKEQIVSRFYFTDYIDICNYFWNSSRAAVVEDIPDGVTCDGCDRCDFDYCQI